MKTTAAVLSGKNKVYIREYELPEIGEEELLVKVISNSVCLSTYKAAIRGEEHKRVPEDISEHPVITGHEFCGIIEKVGSGLKGRFEEGEKFVLQPAMGLESGYSAGYSYEYFGGNATYCIIPKVAIDLGCVLPYKGNYFANASLAEPMSCIIGAFHATYHTTQYVYEHQMGIRENGNMALLGCAGPMGMGAIDYVVNGPRRPKLVVVVDIDEKRLERAKELITPEHARKMGVKLVYVNTTGKDAVAYLKELSGGRGYDDVFVFAPVPALVEQGDDILANDGCLNFFSGPTDPHFKVPFNFYNVHYEGTHIVGTSGGSTGDMMESLELSHQSLINPSFMVTHIGGLNAAPSTILNLPKIPGGKKMIYPHIQMELTAISDFEKLGKDNELFAELDKICKRKHGIWCEEAEQYLLSYYHVL
nr:zinc-binding dehydrogenase [uncultured Blautia sp.]